jgi:hypothetical protein
MAETIQFLPWVRSGIGLSVGTKEPEVLSSLARATTLSAWVELDGEEATTTISLRPPDHVISIDTSQISRRYPAPGTPDAEYGYFPHIEFTAPDLPWLLSPSCADEGDTPATSTGRLRPWLVLVCFEDSLGQLFPGAPQRLIIAASELPDLAESWGWGHVQSAVPNEQLDDALSGAEGLVLSRLVCPRQLEPNTHYRVALVNAWMATADSLVPAWERGGETVTLTVYDTWTFSTGTAGSFEELCERLQPAPEGTLVLGVHTMDMTDLGLINPWGTLETPIRASYTGAIVDAEAVVEELGDAQAPFETETAFLLDQGSVRRELRLKDPDPVVTPPFYGSFAKGAESLPGSGWMAELNLIPRRRAAAGLGSTIVRLHQERYMATAWDQVGQIRESNRLMSQAHLRRSVGQRWKAKAAALDPHQLLSVLRPQMTFVRESDGTPLLRRLRLSTVPNATFSPAFHRALRPAGVIRKTLEAPLTRARQPEEQPKYLNRQHWQRHLRTALNTGPNRADLELRKPRAPGGLRGPDLRREQAKGGFTGIPIPPEPFDPVVMNDERAGALAGIRPARAARAQIEARVPALKTRLASVQDDAMPSRLSSGPVFTEPLSLTLMDLSPELLVPGIDDFPNNTVRLLEADPAYTAAILGGANHEMIRELLWREYPAALDGTAFRRFWARPDPTDVDIKPMKDWQYIQTLERLGAAGGESALLLVRGDLLRQYPATRFLLLEPGKTVPMEPSFTGILPPDISFFGFDVKRVEDLVDPHSEWVIIIEEPAFEPRFGLDLDSDGSSLTSYAELSWEHLEAQTGPYLAIAPETGLAKNSSLAKEATWGLNGAHMAYATYQKPFRRLFRAVDLLGGR